MKLLAKMMVAMAAALYRPSVVEEMYCRPKGEYQPQFYDLPVVAISTAGKPKGKRAIRRERGRAKEARA